MARRSSARLRGRRSATPQRVSLSHDEAPSRTPRTAPSNLASLEETDELPGAFPHSASPCDKARGSQASQASHDNDTTPSRPNVENAKPGLAQLAVAESEARALPSKGTNASLDPKALLPHSQFTFRREHSLQLSPEAKKLMEQNREASMRIREQMAADPEQMEAITNASGRKLATPKTKRSRFSDAHAAAFDKMASIAGHASAFRAQPKETRTTATPPAKRIAVAPPSTLKRVRSQVELQLVTGSPSSVRKSMAGKNAPTPVDDSSRGPLPSFKRIKRAAHEDTSSTRNTTVQSPKPAIPVPSTPLRAQSKLATAAHTPKATASRTSTLSAIKPPTPRLLPSQPQVINSKQAGSESPSRLLSKSPSKVGLFPKPVESRTTSGVIEEEALLSRTPLKCSPKKTSNTTSQSAPQGTTARTPLLSRLAFKRGPTKADSTEQSTSKAPAIPLLARSPSKTLFKQSEEEVKTPHTAGGKSLVGRFNLLRASPMKSILRSPQRLYSDDPEKIAAGTHLATPEKNDSSSAVSSDDHSGAKRVDFTSSTKQRELERQSEDPPSSEDGQATKPAVRVEETAIVEYPTLPTAEMPASPSPQKRRQTAGPGNFTFRADQHGIVFGTNTLVSPAGLKRAAPTIRHVPSNGPTRAPMANGSKKRKFEFENETATTKNDGEQNKENEKGTPEDTEEISQGPAKRVKTAPKPAPKEVSPVKSFLRKPTLGVKPKGIKSTPNEAKKRTMTISQSRLNALAQPKRR